MKMKFSIPFTFSTSWPFIRRRAEPEENPIITEKLFGVSYYDLICHWVNTVFKSEFVIVLTDINVQAKNIEFWSKVPVDKAVNFLQDVVVLRCKDRSEVIRLIENIPKEFAEAYGFAAGVFFIHNKDY